MTTRVYMAPAKSSWLSWLDRYENFLAGLGKETFPRLLHQMLEHLKVGDQKEYTFYAEVTTNHLGKVTLQLVATPCKTTTGEKTTHES